VSENSLRRENSDALYRQDAGSKIAGGVGGAYVEDDLGFCNAAGEDAAGFAAEGGFRTLTS